MRHFRMPIAPSPRRLTHLHDGRELIHVWGCDQTNIQNIASSNILTLISIKVPSQNVLVLTHTVNYLEDMTALGFIVWEMEIDGMPVPNYNSMTWAYDSGGHKKEVLQDIVVPEGATLTVQATNNSGFDYRVGTGVYGVFGTWKHNK